MSPPSPTGWLIPVRPPLRSVHHPVWRSVGLTVLLTVLLSGGLSCGGPAEPKGSPTGGADSAASAAVPLIDPTVGLVPLGDARLLRRMSLDLRGTLPTLAELDAVEADPAALSRIRDEMLADPRFEERLVVLFGEQWHTLVTVYDIEYYDYGLERVDDRPLRRSIGEEPLRLLAYVGARDLPWTEVVTADYMLSNELLGDVWPIDYPEGGEGWQVSQWNDQRPKAGVLVSNGLWWRYTTNTFNQSRSRASALFRLLACTDLLGRPVSFSAAGRTSAEDPSAAILNEPYCVTCHASIEPVAAALFGFWVAVQYSADEMTYYHPEREALASTLTPVEPAWFGEPVYGLEDLGVVIADDPRFSQCAVRRMAKALWRRDTTLTDLPTVLTLDQEFRDEGMRIRSLVIDLTDSAQYRAGAFSADAPQATVDRELTVRMLSPDQLQTAIEELTGFRWTDNYGDQLRDDGDGFRILGGGVDGVSVTDPQQDPGLTWNLVAQNLSRGAAFAGVQHDLIEAPGEARLLTRVTQSSRPGDPEFEAQLVELHRRLLARAPTDAELAELEALWADIVLEDGVQAGWTGMLLALFQDPEFLTE